MKKLCFVVIALLLGMTASFAQTRKVADQNPATTKAAPANTATTSPKYQTGAAPATAATSPKYQTGVATTTTNPNAKYRTQTPLIDINSASQADLLGLPGIDTWLSGQIIAGRPYRTKRDLLTRKILNQVQYDSIKDAIIAHQDKSAGVDKKK